MIDQTSSTDILPTPEQPIVVAPSHKALVNAAVRWLKNNAEVGPLRTYPAIRRCAVVFAEMVSSASETPDAIGFFASGNYSILIECKVSRSDFLRDAKKPFRKRPERGVGDYRYYLAPPGVIYPSELPDAWGLLTYQNKTVEIERLAEQQEKRQRAEVNLLWSAVRRLKTNDTNQRKPIR